MLSIDRVRIVLPHAHRYRARSIARHLSRELGRIEGGAPLRLDSLTVGPISVPPGADDRAVARSAARRVASRVRAARDGRPS